MAPHAMKLPNKKFNDASKLNKLSKKSFKPSDKSNDPPTPNIEDEVPDFPRGGKSILSRREQYEIRAEVDAEFESHSRGSSKNKKRKKTQNKDLTREDEFGCLFGDGRNGKLPRFANKITLKNICPGMKIWGLISEVDQKDIVVSLPGGLRGLVRASDACDPLDCESKDVPNFLPSMFHIGQLVSCIVLQLDEGKKDKGIRKIWLSLRLSLLYKDLTLDAIQEGMVLTAYVKSIEDHGYILHFGLNSFTGFCPKVSQDETRETKLNPCQLLQATVRRIDSTRKFVHLIHDSDLVSKCVTKDLKGLSINHLVPGMMVNASVRSILENGIMLSFLTYFTGTVDIFHLQNTFPTASWKDDYHQNKKVNVRILFIDPVTRAVGLTMNSHLIRNRAPPIHVNLGDIYDHSKVVRVDGDMGLLLDIPSIPERTPSYITKLDITDGEVSKLTKKFKEGSDVSVRILGIKHFDGLAMGTLKASALEGSLFIHSDVKPGMVVKGKVILVDNFGAIVKFSSGVKALCPLPHMSEFEIAKPGKKFKVGAELVFRVLGCKSKRITVTYKKTLVKSKLEVISSYTDATGGLKTHGWITKIAKPGCFVRFYNGVQGFVPRSELGLEPGCDATDVYHIGQVVKCRVTSYIPASRRINLSFLMKASSISEDDMVKLGSLISGVVDRKISNAIIVHVKGRNYLKGTISTQHLSDHDGHATLMQSTIKPGYEFEELLVLDMDGRNLILTAKYSLIKPSYPLPLDLDQVQPYSVVPGYICNIIDTGCFVRFLGRLTGFCPKNKAIEDQRANLAESFYVGQSVRSYILDIKTEKNRLTVSLKQSSCSSTDVSFIQEYFVLEERIAMLLDNGSTELKWVGEFGIGSIVEGKIHETKDFGVVISFEKHSDVFGFITHYQLGGTTVEAGSTVRAVVLDVAMTEHLVDLSLKLEFVDKFNKKIVLKSQKHSKSHIKKRKREVVKDLEVQQTVNATVEIVKENYLVLSIPEHNYIVGYASLTDYNTQKFPQKQFENGQCIVATILALPSVLTSGRLLMLLKCVSEDVDTSSSKKAKKNSIYNVGSLIQAEITDISPLELRVKFGIGFRGRVHITETNNDKAVKDPFNNYKVGEMLIARIVGKTRQVANKKQKILWELSVKPNVITNFKEIKDSPETLDFTIGQYVTGYVYKVDSEWAWLTVSRNVSARLFILDSAIKPSELEQFQTRFSVGKSVSGYILSIVKEKKILRLVLHPLLVLSGKKNPGQVQSGDSEKENIQTHIQEGDVVGGRISKVLPDIGGLAVQISPRIYGKVHFTELRDSWDSDPLSGYHEGQFVKCKVLEISNTFKGTVHVDLSLRSSLDGMHNMNSAELEINDIHSPTKYVTIDDLHPNMDVQGYVKSVTSKGCFILLSRKLDAKILIFNLSDKFIQNPEVEFPVGKLVKGRVLSVEPLSKRVEVTLRSSNSSTGSQSNATDLSNLHVGDVISGTIRRVESFGLFIMINETNWVGLCHVSEISDAHVDNLQSKYKAGESVTAKILKVDEERQRICLGMKESYFENDNIDSQLISNESPKQNMDIELFPQVYLPGVQNVYIEGENIESHALAQAESRASICPLEVIFDDGENSDSDNLVTEKQDHVNEGHENNKKVAKGEREKQKAKREKEIRASEERLLEQDMPRTADEFEKLVRSSPNSSFVWIKYMAFTLSLCDIEKARSIAERALSTMNSREESEKLNIWVAYFNLENKYGNPPEAAVMKIFQRALQYCDSEKVHLSLLDMYERTNQDNLVDELLNKMTKKFKRSIKIWLKQIEWILNHKGDEVQSVLNRALLCLPSHEHINIIKQTAILEFKCGVPERGRSMFEGILKEYPKRTDLWSVYLDQEIRLGDEDIIRGLFERSITLIVSAKKMEPLFKKYLEYEKSHGDVNRIESVKKKAMDYVNSQ